MAGAAVLGRLTWEIAQVTETKEETARVRTIALDVPEWRGHRAGQHVDVRLTAEDGYQAERSYSIASPPGRDVELTVERLEDGEVSPYLVDELRPGDGIEIRGPIGGYFVWEGSDVRPALLLAGGSGIVPLMAMIRHRVATASPAPMRLVYSSRTAGDIIYRSELDEIAVRVDGVEVVHTLTRERPDGWTGRLGRIGPELLHEVAWPPADEPAVYVCGSTGFVEGAAQILVEMGYEPRSIRTERYGGTGG